MTIWILALVLLAVGAGLGYTQGAIRAAISFVGIVVAALFAGLLGNSLKSLLPHLGVHNPLLLWMLAPMIAFILILVLFKVAGFFVHRKIYLFYKYQAGDLRLALWKRLNSRLGLCTGLLNGVAYLLLASFVIFNISYWTIQVAPSEKEAFEFRALNTLGQDLESTGLAGPAQLIAPFSKTYYRLADFAGLLRQNPQLKTRLEDYPPFLSLVDNNNFKQLDQDSKFQDAWKNHAPLTDMLKNPQLMAFLKNTSLTATVAGLIQANWDDLNTYLKTGRSPKYESEKILGRWDFNVAVSVGHLLIAHPRITAAQVKGLRALWSQAYAGTVLIVAADHQVFLRNIPTFEVKKGAAVVAKKIDFHGKWTNQDANYKLSLTGDGHSKSMTGTTDGLRLTLKSATESWVFDRQ